MNWTWSLRSSDGGMNGLEFARSLTAAGLTRVLVHAAPAKLAVEVVADDGHLVARGEAERQGSYSPMTELTWSDEKFHRSEIWPTEEHQGLPVLLAGGEVGVLTAWRHADDRSWWQWSVEFANHTGRPAGWAPPDGKLKRG